MDYNVQEGPHKELEDDVVERCASEYNQMLLQLVKEANVDRLPSLSI